MSVMGGEPGSSRRTRRRSSHVDLCEVMRVVIVLVVMVALLEELTAPREVSMRCLHNSFR